MISQGFFFIFSKFWLFGLLSGVRQKCQNDKNLLSVPPHESGTIHHMIVIDGALV